MFTAVIVEPRKHKALELVLLNFNKNLDENWEFLIYHGTQNKTFIDDILNNTSFVNRKIRLISLNIDNLTIDDYNKLMYSEFYYNNINTEIFLVFQTDTLLSDIYSKDIYKFIDYDYVGAPWKNIKLGDSNLVGNGGLSLRKKSKMIEMLHLGENFKDGCGKYYYEDRFFSNTTHHKLEIVLDIPTADIAKQFSVETMFFDKSIGLHNSWRYITKEQLEILKTHFFDLDNLIKSQYCV
jgi:hypothetical protein